MAGLVSYASSDEEDHMEVDVSRLNADRPSSPSRKHTNGHKSGAQQNGTTVGSALPESEAPIVGPILAPSADLVGAGLPEEDEGEQTMAPQSPYSATRALLRDLTLPSLPNYDIPPAPPGSPLESTNAKFKHFLDLKKKGVHFNDKLANSSALMNPSLMQKLMDFSDIDEAGQYATTLPKELWNPDGFPSYAFKEELARSQQKILKKKEDEKSRGQRESLDFVPATPSTEPVSRNGTPSNGGRPTQKSAAERVMAGLDRGRSNSPQVQGTKRKSRFDS
ncbi:HCNGP-like protein-domain-containing protein [Rhexocercosporidium sp. MPI-PUGE-AT-0058]|nr:HCNGP-like protein-domain-containing protein [Rhexocercosporidium sp. MPI-PUGE-AT-0058]